MFYVKEPSLLGSSWLLSQYNDEKVVAIAEDVTRDLKNYHILGIDFLYKNFNKQFKGAILNEDEGMNMHIQVAAFLRAAFNYIDKKFLVLIIAPDNLMIKWHYHLKKHAGLKVQIVTPSTCPEDFDQEHGLALLLSFSNIRLAEYLVDYDYFSVIVDNLDEVALKLIIKKLYGNFNIGLTYRSFYINPNQKLQWTMLNWSNPGCVGKLSDFYEIDNDNFANFRDNYRHWWFRLTWGFCETFTKITDEENKDYIKTLSKWAHTHHLTKPATAKRVEKKGKKRKQYEMIDDVTMKKEVKEYTKTEVTNNQTISTKQSSLVEDTVNKQNGENNSLDNILTNFKDDVMDLKGESQNSDRTIIYRASVEDHNGEHKKSGSISSSYEEKLGNTKQESQSSDSTIIYGEYKNERDPNYVELPSMDENPILNSIIRNFEKSAEPIKARHSSCTYTTVKYDMGQPNCSKVFEEEDVLMSIINDTSTLPASQELDDESQINYKKEKIYSQIFSDDPCTSRSMQIDDDDDDNGFIESLVDSDNDIKSKKESRINNIKNSDIEDILKETDLLLTE